MLFHLSVVHFLNIKCWLILYDIYHILFIHFFVDGMYVCCFTFWLLLRKLSVKTSGWKRSQGRCMFVLRHCHTVFQYGYTILHSYYQFVRVFLILVILVSRRWHLTLDLICSSLMTNDVGHPFMCLLAIPCLLCEVWILYLVKYEFKTLLHFLNWVFVFLSMSSFIFRL